ncbi:unnamed protein product [Scytosiphon promiscuus]
MLQGTKTLVGNGRVRDVYFVEHEGRKVVVKTLRGATDLKSQRNALDRHNREVQTLDAMRGHPNIVGMLGVCDTTVVTEYYSASFQGVLFRNKQPLPIRRVVSMALDAARGLQVRPGCLLSIECLHWRSRKSFPHGRLNTSTSRASYFTGCESMCLTTISKP